MGLYVEGVDANGTHQEGFESNAVGERRLILRAGSYHVLAGARTCAFDVIAGETVHVPVESRQHGELVVELSTHRGYQLAAANIELPFAMCVSVEDPGHRYLFLDPGIYTVLWGPGKFRLGEAGVRTNQVTSARFEVPPAKIVLRFSGRMRGRLDVAFGLRGGPRGFIGPRYGRWREDVLIDTDGTDYAITGLHPGTYQLTLGGDIPTRTLTVDASAAPRTVRVLTE